MRLATPSEMACSSVRDEAASADKLGWMPDGRHRALGYIAGVQTLTRLQSGYEVGRLISLVQVI